MYESTLKKSFTNRCAKQKPAKTGNSLPIKIIRLMDGGFVCYCAYVLRIFECEQRYFYAVITVRERQILARAVGIRNEIWVNHVYA